MRANILTALLIFNLGVKICAPLSAQVTSVPNLGTSASGCSPAAGTTNSVMFDNGLGCPADSPASINPSTGNFTTPGTMQTGVGGTLSGMTSWGPNTSQPSIPANAFSIVAPTTYTQQLAICPPNAVPTANQFMLFPAPTSNQSCWAWQTYSSQIYKGGASIGSPFSGTPLTVGLVGYGLAAPAGCTIKNWNMQVDGGTATVQFMKVAAGTALPTHASNNISTAGVSISSGTMVVHNTTLTDFTTTAVSTGDTPGIYISAVSGVDYLAAWWECQ